jgi:hypothetical protein
MTHFVSDKSLERPGYIYENGVGYPIGVKPAIVWNHIDGPLLHTSDCGLHWLTLWERIQLHLGLTDINAIDKRRRRDAQPRR